jgi:hypothetical protein
MSGGYSVKNSFLRTFATVGLSCGLFLFIQTASAGVVGTLLTGSSGTVTATSLQITFSNDSAALGGSNFACPAMSLTCDSDVSSGTSLTFAGCTGVLGSAGCLSGQEGVDVNSPISASSIGESSFLTFSNNANLVYSLLGIFTGTASSYDCATLTVGNSCYIYPGAALQLTLEPGNTTQVTITLFGHASDAGVAGLPTASTYIGGFTEDINSTLPNGTAPTPGNIQAYFCGGSNNVTSVTQCLNGASLTSSQSGSFFATAVPEPSSIAFALLGGVLILAARSRWTKRSRL